MMVADLMGLEEGVYIMFVDKSALDMTIEEYSAVLTQLSQTRKVDIFTIFVKTGTLGIIEKVG